MEAQRKFSAKAVDSDHTLSGRFASVFASLLFSLPICGLLWLIINYELATVSDLTLHAGSFLLLIGFMAVFAFVFPKVFPTLFGWLCNVVFAIGKYW